MTDITSVEMAVGMVKKHLKEEALEYPEKVEAALKFVNACADACEYDLLKAFTVMAAHCLDADSKDTADLLVASTAIILSKSEQLKKVLGSGTVKVPANV